MRSCFCCGYYVTYGVDKLQAPDDRAVIGWVFWPGLGSHKGELCKSSGFEDVKCMAESVSDGPSGSPETLRPRLAAWRAEEP